MIDIWLTYYLIISFQSLEYSNEKLLLYNGMYSVVLSAQTQFLGIL